MGLLDATDLVLLARHEGRGESETFASRAPVTVNPTDYYRYRVAVTLASRESSEAERDHVVACYLCSSRLRRRTWRALQGAARSTWRLLLRQR